MPHLPSKSELLDPAAILAHANVTLNMRVADLCCGGAGQFVFPMSRMVGENGVVYAVDILKPVLNSVDSRAKIEGEINITTVWSDLERYGATKIENESLDVITFVNDEPNIAMLKEATRLLKPGGVLLIVDWNTVGAPFGPPPEKRVSPSEYKETIPPLGYTLKEQFIAGPYHYGLVFHRVA